LKMEYALFNHRTPVHFLVIHDSVIITPIYVITTSISNIISFVYNYQYFIVIYILLAFVSVLLYTSLTGIQKELDRITKVNRRIM
jgi:hypothetical protein